MSDISRGATFTTSIPDAPTLHQLVDSATILPGFITGKSSSQPGNDDAFVFVKSGSLRQCSLAALVAAFPNGAAANVAALRKLGTAATTACAGNDPRLPSRITGVRMANGTSPDTVAAPKNISFADQSLSGTSIIDWDVANIFTDNMVGNKTYLFANARNGREIKVIIKLNGHVPLFPTTLGAIQTLGAGTIARIYTFVATSVGTGGYYVAI